MIHSGTRILDNTVIGENCEIHNNVVIGADGFGWTVNKKGEYEENLALRKWTTFTDEKTFAIQKSQVVVHHSVTLGLTKYYEYIIKRFKDFDNHSSLKKANDELESKMSKEPDISEEDKFEELIDEYCNYYPESKFKN